MAIPFFRSLPLPLAVAAGAGTDIAAFMGLVKGAGLGAFGANLLACGAGLLALRLLARAPLSLVPKAKRVQLLLWLAAIALIASWLVLRLMQGGMSTLTAKLVVTGVELALSGVALVWISRATAGLARISGAAALIAAAGWSLSVPATPSFGSGLSDAQRALYPAAPEPAAGGLKIYHLGHSLVGRDMPAMLQQLAGADHGYASQLGWGTSIAQHLAGPAQVQGFDTENDHPHHLPLQDALADPSFDILVMTESVDLRDAIIYQNSPDAVARLVSAARAANPALGIALYETWHSLDQGDWLGRIAGDRARMWEPALLAPAVQAGGVPVRVIPAGTVMAALVGELEAEGTTGFTRRDLFSDDIHLNDIGAYLVALTHYASLYGRSPEGLPHQLRRADGSPADAPSPELAARMQRVVWQVVSGSPLHR